VNFLMCLFAPMSAARQAEREHVAKYASDVYEVTGPHGKATVTGYMRCELGSGILTFRNADGMVTETFAPSGWWHLVKVGDGRSVQPRLVA
jgi:hypothetical protein